MPSGEHQETGASNGRDDKRRGRTTAPAKPVRATPVPSSTPEQAEQHAQAALAAGTRTGASLSALFRAVEEMTDGLSGAQEANRQLVRELKAMHRMLAESAEQNAALELRLAALGEDRDAVLHELEQMRVDTERDKAFLVDEQDRFLAALLEEHERALDALRRERDEARSRASTDRRDRTTRPRTPLSDDTNDHRSGKTDAELREARRTIEKLLNERSRSREMLRRLKAQRDEAQMALAGASTISDAPLDVTVRPSTATSGEDGVTGLPKAVPAKPGKDTRRTAPQGPRARTWDETKSERKTDPLPRSDLAMALEASQPSQLDREPAPKEQGSLAATAAPEELRAAVTATPAVPETQDHAPRGQDGKPLLGRKPNPTKQPLGGYSLGADDVEAERIEGTRRGSSKPPAG